MKKNHFKIWKLTKFNISLQKKTKLIILKIDWYGK